jgi:prepilin-type N-terminal cleavage/methylation domain-containing protein
MPTRRGFTFVEILMVMIIVGIVVVISVPKYAQASAKAKARSAKQEIAAYLAQTRAAAIRSGKSVSFVRSANVIMVMSDTATLASRQDLGAQFGVTVSATKDTVTYDSRGLIPGNSSTLMFTVTNGTARDSVCVIALGKIAARGCSL